MNHGIFKPEIERKNVICYFLNNIMKKLNLFCLKQFLNVNNDRLLILLNI